MIGASRLDCLLETGMWMHNIWSFQRYECSVQAMLLLTAALSALICEQDSVLRTHGSLCHPPLQHTSKEAPTQFTSYIHFSLTLWCAGCGCPVPTWDGTESLCRGTRTSQSNHLSARPTAPSCWQVRASSLSLWAFLYATLNPHTKSFVPKEMMWWHMPEAVSETGNAKENLILLTGWNCACEGPSTWWLILSAFDVGRTLPVRRLLLRTRHISQLNQDR